MCVGLAEIARRLFRKHVEIICKRRFREQMGKNLWGSLWRALCKVEGRAFTYPKPKTLWVVCLNP